MQLIMETFDKSIIVSALDGIFRMTELFEQSIEPLSNHPAIHRIVIYASIYQPKDIYEPCIKIVGAMSSSSIPYAKKLVELGLLATFEESLTKCTIPSVIQDILWALSNMIFEGEDIIQHVHSANLFPIIVSLTSSPDNLIKREALWCIVNAVKDASPFYLNYLKSIGAFEALTAARNAKVTDRFDLLGVIEESLEGNE